MWLFASIRDFRHGRLPQYVLTQCETAFRKGQNLSLVGYMPTITFRRRVEVDTGLNVPEKALWHLNDTTDMAI